MSYNSHGHVIVTVLFIFWKNQTKTSTSSQVMLIYVFLTRVCPNKELVPHPLKILKPQKCHSHFILYLFSIPKCHQPSSYHLWFQSYVEKFGIVSFPVCQPKKMAAKNSEKVFAHKPILNFFMQSSLHLDTIFFNLSRILPDL